MGQDILNLCDLTPGSQPRKADLVTPISAVRKPMIGKGCSQGTMERLHGDSISWASS